MTLKLIDGIKPDFDDVLIVPKRSVMVSRSAVKLERDFYFYHSSQVWEGFPLMCSNMYCTGTFEMANALIPFKAITCLQKFYTVDQLLSFFDNQDRDIRCQYAWVSIGIKNEDFDKIKQLYFNLSLMSNSVALPNIVIDVANGYSDSFVNKCAEIRKFIGDEPILMAGNVCTPEMTQELIIHGGVDIVKVGIGPGAFCETRKVTGIGFPQFSAIADCADAAHGLKNLDKPKGLGLVCGDGGCKTSGDICKAYGAGADFVMLGTYLAGTEECQGEWEYYGFEHQYNYEINPNGKKRLKFYGMSSDHAQNTHYGKKIDYAASEGRVGYVDYKGPVENTIKEIQGGLRSYCAYINAPTLKDAPKCTTFVRIK